jgi:hypothetical protein
MTAKRQLRPKRSKPWLLTWTEGHYGTYNSQTGEPRKRSKRFEFGDIALLWEERLIAQGFHPKLKLEGLDQLNLSKLDLTGIASTPLGEMVRRELAHRAEEKEAMRE